MVRSFLEPQTRFLITFGDFPYFVLLLTVLFFNPPFTSYLLDSRLLFQWSGHRPCRVYKLFIFKNGEGNVGRGVFGLNNRTGIGGGDSIIMDH